ncbi:hypothetical protein HKCCE3408_12970 [Rhodobacterales bacterium HKCCE3408]|nr:hypothetical protein [Rhodobacterales bacterium HKCCE3408]
MAEMTLTRVGMRAGRYEGVLDGSPRPFPVIELVHRERVVALAEIAEEDGRTRVTADLPAEILTDGVQVVAVRSADGAVLDRVTLLVGSALEEDFRAELRLMREELELLKSAFRRHCQETGET